MISFMFEALRVLTFFFFGDFQNVFNCSLHMLFLVKVAKLKCLLATVISVHYAQSEINKREVGQQKKSRQCTVHFINMFFFSSEKKISRCLQIKGVMNANFVEE